MNKIMTLTAAATVLAISSTSALSQANDTERFLMKGVSTPTCELNVSAIGDFTGGDPFEVDFGELPDDLPTDTGSVTEVRATFEIFCNRNFQIGVKSRDGGFRNTDTSPGDLAINDFANCFKYDIETYLNGSFATTFGKSAGGANCTTANKVKNGTTIFANADGILAITFTDFSPNNSGDTNKIQAGQYRDLVTLKVGNPI